MIGAWQDLGGRERGLIAAAGLLALLVLVVQLGVQPLIDARDAARRGHEAAVLLVSEMAEKAARLDDLRRSRDGSPPPDAATTRLAVGRTAQARGVAITRLTPEPDGALHLWIDDAGAAALFAWLVELDRKHGIQVRKADMSAGRNGRGVRLQIRLAGGEGA